MYWSYQSMTMEPSLMQHSSHSCDPLNDTGHYGLVLVPFYLWSTFMHIKGQTITCFWSEENNFWTRMAGNVYFLYLQTLGICSRAESKSSVSGYRRGFPPVDWGHILWCIQAVIKLIKLWIGILYWNVRKSDLHGWDWLIELAAQLDL